MITKDPTIEFLMSQLWLVRCMLAVCASAKISSAVLELYNIRSSVDLLMFCGGATVATLFPATWHPLVRMR